MTKPKRMLLVEGINDKSFFEEFCKMLGLNADVRVAPPRELGGEDTFNTKQGAINYLPSLLKRFPTGELERIGLVLDADQTQNGGGFEKTVGQVALVLESFGFAAKPTALADGGLVFRHNDGLADFGLWVMPDNGGDGILEDWIYQSVPIAGSGHALLRHAECTVAALPTVLNIPKIKPTRIKKAEVATWLAWQERPGEGLYYAIKGKLLDPAALGYIGLQAWMRHVFK